MYQEYTLACMYLCDAARAISHTARAHGKVYCLLLLLLNYHVKMKLFVCLKATKRDCTKRRRQKYAEWIESRLGIEDRQNLTLKGN